MSEDPAAEPGEEAGDGEGDALPADLDVTAAAGEYSFPDIRRRRWPAFIYFVTAAVCAAAWLLTRGSDPVLVNDGFLVLAIGLGAAAAYQLSAAWNLAVDDSQALVAAAREVGFAVGHASAQLGGRGLRSRPTWRILLYSTENPPARRGLVLVDAVDGTVVEHLVQDNPEDWAER